MNVPDEMLTESHIVTSLGATKAMLLADQGAATMEVVILTIKAFKQEDAAELGISAPQTGYDFIISPNDAKSLIALLSPLAAP